MSLEVLTGILVIFLTVLGSVVSFMPPETSYAKWGLVIVFVVLGVAVIILTYLQVEEKKQIQKEAEIEQKKLMEEVLGLSERLKNAHNDIITLNDKIQILSRQIIGKQQGATLDPHKIKVFLYKAEIYQYKNATDGNSAVIIDPKEPIHVPFNPDEKMHFYFGVANQNPGIPFEDVLLQVFFDPKDQLEVTEQGMDDPKEERRWRRQSTNVQYWYHFTRINNEWRNTWYGLFVKFPKRGSYTFKFSVDGIGIKHQVQTEVSVVVD